MDVKRLSLLCMGIGIGVIFFGVLIKMGMNTTFEPNQAATPLIGGAALLIASYYLFKRANKRR